MKTYSTLHPTESGPLPTDGYGCFLLAANAAQAMDYPSGAGIIRLACATTAGAVLALAFNPTSTSAQWGSSIAPSSGVTTATSLQNAVIPPGSPMTYQVPAGSTGFSVIAPAAGVASVEFWKR